MRNSSSLISLIIPLALLLSCQSPQGTSTDDEIKDSLAITDTSGMQVDTLHSEAMTAEGRSVSQAGEGGQDQVNRKVITLDTPIVIREAPKHAAPGQSSIDSIKQAKQRLKK